jgi:hypothetical protein
MDDGEKYYYGIYKSELVGERLKELWLLQPGCQSSAVTNEWRPKTQTVMKSGMSSFQSSGVTNEW